MGSVQNGLSKELLVEEIDTQRKDKQDRREHKKDVRRCPAAQTEMVILLGQSLH